MMNEDQVSRLLRLKRFEQPPEGFHEEFLREFRRRQRVALMRPSLLERLRESLHEKLSALTPSVYAYASVIVVAFAISSVMLLEDSTPASTSQPTLAAGISLNTPPPVNIPDSLLQRSTKNPQSAALPAHYVLESRPVSYDAPFSF